MIISNLLTETILDLEKNNKTLEDVEFCLIENRYFSVELFKKISNKSYNCSFGGNEVNLSLVLVGKDFWLERWEYAGSEGWVYKSLPKKTELEELNPKIFEDVFCD